MWRIWETANQSITPLSWNERGPGGRQYKFSPELALAIHIKKAQHQSERCSGTDWSDLLFTHRGSQAATPSATTNASDSWVTTPVQNSGRTPSAYTDLPK
jgi:hypothetical protein